MSLHVRPQLIPLFKFDIPASSFTQKVNVDWLVLYQFLTLDYWSCTFDHEKAHCPRPHYTLRTNETQRAAAAFINILVSRCFCIHLHTRICAFCLVVIHKLCLIVQPFKHLEKLEKLKR